MRKVRRNENEKMRMASEKKKNNMNCKEANEIQIADFLLTQSIEPNKILGNDFWYLSPLRNERTPSFKVDISINRWYDHGMGVGGKLVDLGVRLFQETVTEFLLRLDGSTIKKSFSFHKPETEKVVPVIKKIKRLENKALLSYLDVRAIRPLWVARTFCQEVYFSIGTKNYFGIGFKNNLGGYEIRNKFFKGCLGPKRISSINRDSKTYFLFEGFIDFISAYQQGSIKGSSYIILNSTTQIRYAIAELQAQGAEDVSAYFDNDWAGRNCFKTLKQSFPNAKDCSSQYAEFNDFNEMVTHTNPKYHD